jgi:hypothetical protein
MQADKFTIYNINIITVAGCQLPNEDKLRRDSLYGCGLVLCSGVPLPM